MSLFEEYENILMDMTEHHSIFYKLWSITSPRFSNDVETACVYFDSEGNEIVMEFSETFWESLTDVQKRFVICHETLHILLNHGKRSIKNKQISDVINAMQDIVINERLTSMYGFKRIEIDPENRYCWADTVFPDIPDIPTDESFEYYFNLYIENNKKAPSSDGEVTTNGRSSIPSTVDDHDRMGDIPNLDSISESLSKEEKEYINDFIETATEGDATAGSKRGTSRGNSVMTFTLEPVKKKRKWETVISRWANKFIKETEVDIDQWAVLDRRLFNLSSDLMLPSEYELDDLKDDFNKIDVWFFQDTSGSCVSYAKRFFKAARTLPEDRFNLRLFCFDTDVYETDITSGKLYGFGGTSFTVIEEHIQNLCQKEKVKYPKAIFVITDGYGDYVKPQYPKNWFWFLTKGGSSNYIHKDCNIFKLEDFE